MLAWLALTAILGLGAWLRLGALDLGYSSDEVGTVTGAGFRGIFDHPETGVNPPLWRWMFNLPFSPWDAPWWGRRFSFVMSELAIVLGFVVGRRAGGGSAWAGLGAALLLAAHPWCVRYGVTFRVYATWSAVLLAHVWSLGHALEREAGPARRPWLVLAVVTAVVAPWLHYFSVPVLLVLGAAVLLGMPGRRRLVALYVPAALGVTPLVPYVLFEEGRRVAPDREPLRQVLVKLSSLDVQPPPLVWSALWRGLSRVLGFWPDLGLTMTTTTLLLLLLVLVRWRAATPTLRLAAAGLAGVLGGTALLAQVQYVRPSTLVMVLTFAGPALVAAPSVLPWRLARVLGVVAVTGWYAGNLPHHLTKERQTWEVERGIPWVLDHAEELEARRGGRPYVVSPAHRLWTVWFHLAHSEPRAATRGEGCTGWRPCFEHEGVVWAGVDAVDGSLLDALVLYVDAWRTEELGRGCEVVHDGGAWVLLDCHAEPVDPVPPRL
ncbi:MAG: hypothetical protein H6732_11695 [Alphaproteobacteria bacterium]|nr:hypothetical protein [Alphaproteobacteria bacterium]